MSNEYIRYEVLDEQYTPADGHTAVGENEYLAPQSCTELEQLEEIGWVNVHSWEYTRDDTVTFDGPPELVCDEDGEYRIVTPGPDGRSLQTHSPAAYRCQRCGTVTDLGPVTDATPGTPEPSECAGCDRQGPFNHALSSRYTEDELQPVCNAKPIWTLPETVDDTQSFSEVFEAVRAYIYRHWDAGEEREQLYDGLAAYAISTWFRDEMDYLPHLMVLGRHETGKTRLLNTLNKVSFRPVTTASASPAAVYRSIDNLGVTMLISEYHDLHEDTQRQIDASIKAGQKRGEAILRAEDDVSGGYSVKSFSPFTHIAIATQFEPRDDIVSRCFTVQTRPATRDMPAGKADATHLRNQLLYHRFRYLNSESIAEAKAQAESVLEAHNVRGRMGEKLHAPLVVGQLADRSLSEFVQWTAGTDKQGRADTEEAKMLQSVVDSAFHTVAHIPPNSGLSDDWSELEIPVSDVTERFNKMTGRDVSPAYIGKIRSRLGLPKKRKASGIHIHGDGLRTRLKQECKQNNLDWSPSEGAVPEMEDDRWENAPEAGGSGRLSGSTAADSETVSSVETEVFDRVSRAETVTSGIGGVPETDLLEAMQDDGYDTDKANHAIENLLQNGRLYEPTDGTLKTSG